MIDVPAGHLFLGEHLDPGTRKRNGEPDLFEAADITTHGVMVEMTGSGKTGLGVAFIEEAMGVAMDRVAQAEAAETTRRQSDMVAAAGSLLGGRHSARAMARDMSRVLTGRGRQGEAAQRVRTAENRALDRQEALTKLEADLAGDLAAIDERWAAKAAAMEPIEVPLERSDIRVTARCVVWIPVG